MNLSRTAIRYAVNRNSAATSLRLCLRFLALWMLVWAASDLFFVWYWTGRLGPGAHEYFGRWFLAGLFTQKLPLYFLSLPYGNGRYTIGSMYAFLKWRFYLGRSFGEWYAYYSLWGLLPASLSIGAIGYLILHDPEDRREGTKADRTTSSANPAGRCSKACFKSRHGASLRASPSCSNLIVSS